MHGPSGRRYCSTHLQGDFFTRKVTSVWYEPRSDSRPVSCGGNPTKGVGCTPLFGGSACFIVKMTVVGTRHLGAYRGLTTGEFQKEILNACYCFYKNRFPETLLPTKNAAYGRTTGVEAKASLHR